MKDNDFYLIVDNDRFVFQIAVSQMESKDGNNYEKKLLNIIYDMLRCQDINVSDISVRY